MQAVFILVIISVSMLAFWYIKRTQRMQISIVEWRKKAEVGDKARMLESDFRFNYGKITKIKKDGTFIIEFEVSEEEVFPPFK